MAPNRYYETNKKAKVMVISDIEGRYDLLILFLMKAGKIALNKLTAKQLLVLTKQPRQYTQEDFDTLYNINLKNILKPYDPKEPQIVINGDIFGNRVLYGRCKNPNKPYNKKTNPYTVVVPKADKGGIMFNGTEQENVFNYQHTIQMNNKCKEACLLLAQRQDCCLIAGNHEIYGSYSGKTGKGRDAILDNLYVYHTNSSAIQSNFQPDQLNVQELQRYKFTNQGGYNELDVIKYNFIYELQQSNKNLLLYKNIKINDIQFLFKHAPHINDNETLKSIMSDKFDNKGYFVPEVRPNSGENIFTQSQSQTLRNFIDGRTDNMFCKDNLCNLPKKSVLIYGHTHTASENKKKQKTNRSLCVDCDMYKQISRGAQLDNMNYFSILENGKIEERNLYSNEKIYTFDPINNCKIENDIKKDQNNDQKEALYNNNIKDKQNSSIKKIEIDTKENKI